MFIHTKSNLQSKAVSLLNYSWTFVTNRPYLKENLDNFIVWFFVF